ncbi:MAG: tRNA dihydrouridine synthase DusB [Desulfuromonadaceae bacterium GWC2_58_13]|nr:MAG: tRNA dihydrouridine synthase DusB [Desulfuromonadaceae bacterium GWC2_58_13]
MKIGSLDLTIPIWLAPMAGITNLPYRLIMKNFGAGLVFTEMVSANGLIHSGRRTRVLLDSSPGEKPLGIQLFGDTPELLAKAAILVEEDGDLLDINLGCPVKKVVRSGAGSALLRSPKKIGQIVSAIRRATARPLTVKIRAGWDQQSINFIETARIAEAEGADAITLHPRTRCQGFSGRADWEQIRQLKQAVKIPVIGSGDIFIAEDALAMLKQSGCDAVMIGRGAYGNPWLLRDIKALLDGQAQPPPPTPEDRLEVAAQHITLYTQTYGPCKALLDMRKHLCWYSRGMGGAAAFRAAVNRAQSVSELQQLSHDFFISAQAAVEGIQ